MSNQKHKIVGALLRAIAQGDDNPSKRVATHFGVTRRYANRLLHELVEAGVLTAEGETRARRYELKMKTAKRTFPINGGIREDRVWRDFAKPFFEGLPERALNICHHGITEIVNNALDHSEAGSFSIQIGTNPALTEIGVVDVGIGIFKKIMRELDLEDEEHAAFELSKGKLTTDPGSHTGEGIFFTSRMFDVFSISSGRIVFHHASAGRDFVISFKDHSPGTFVRMRVNPNTRRTPQAVYEEFTTGEDDPSFSVTHVPVRLVDIGEENLISRSQAKRLMARMSVFKRIRLDFGGVKTIGQAFADEVFRVWANEHRDSEVTAHGANRDVRRMIDRAEAARAEGTTRTNR